MKIISPKKSFWLVLKRPGSLDTFNVAKTGNLIASIDLPEHNHTTLVNINLGISIDTNITTIKTVRNMATRLHNLHGNEVDITFDLNCRTQVLARTKFKAKLCN